MSLFDGLFGDKVVLATGGGSGIGRAVVDALVGEGARVGVLDIAEDRLRDLDHCHGKSVTTIAGDVTVLEDNQRAVEQTIDVFGRIDILLIFPGVTDFMKTILDVPPEKLSDAFDELFAINVKGAMLSSRAAVDELIRTGGNIVLTVSTSGFVPGSGGILYTPSKFALRGLVVQMAYELAPKVRVNGVAPGGTALTQIHGLEALDEGTMTARDLLPTVEAARALVVSQTPLDWEPVPQSHVGAYLYLASNILAPAVTGVTLLSDGGVGVRGVRKIAGFKDFPSPTRS